AAYLLKVLGYIAGWAYFCCLDPGLGGLEHIGSWWLSPVAFQKAILWSLLFEILGLGCGSGPLTGRYLPPLGGALYFLRLGTTKLALFPNAPLIGGLRRGRLDVSLYALSLVLLLAALSQPVPSRGLLTALVVAV